MRKFFKRIAAFFVRAYARRMYRKAVDIAEKRHSSERTTIYVFSSPFNPSSLLVSDRNEFREIKRRMGVTKSTIAELKEGCWYHTSDAAGRGGLRPLDERARQEAFIRMILKRAGV